MRIWTISDTHEEHEGLTIPKDIDMVIHAGDEANNRVPEINEGACYLFMDWFNDLDIEYKIFVPGNHSTAFAKGLIDMKLFPTIKALVHEEVTIEGIKIFGSPYTPTFGYGWAYNKARHKMHKAWSVIPDDTNILVTHGPPKGVLDITQNRDHTFEQCGCKSLLNKVLQVQPDYHIFGHLHDEPSIYNAGRLKLNRCHTTFINPSCVDIRHKLVNNGEIIEYK